MESINSISPFSWSLIILSSATVFVVVWLLDAMTHAKIAGEDLTDKELQVHRNILAASMAMEASLVGMYWLPLLMLPLFIAAFLTRFVQEFVDELHFHTERCTPYESTLHQVMWISVLTKTAAMFIWGFFTSFHGILDLPWYMFLWAGLVLASMSIISFFEWRR
jgi:hypothetical protein